MKSKEQVIIETVMESMRLKVTNGGTMELILEKNQLNSFAARLVKNLDLHCVR